MESETVDWTQVSGTIQALRQELSHLTERVAALEAAAAVPALGARGRPPLAPLASSSTSGRQPVPSAEGLSEELILVISAAIAAFLGKRPHIRQIRLLGAATWAQQGRVTIQASH